MKECSVRVYVCVCAYDSVSASLSVSVSLLHLNLKFVQSSAQSVGLAERVSRPHRASVGRAPLVRRPVRQCLCLCFT